MKRSKSQRGRDRRLIANLYLKGEYQADIAASVGISQSAVSKELAKLQDEWRQSALVDIDTAKSRELAKIDTLELEYWAAWKRSQENAEVETTKMQGGTTDAPNKLEKQKRVEGQVGDPRYLAGVQWCIERRCAIVGIDAPKKQEVSLKMYEVVEEDDDGDTDTN
jgi:DNA-binding transcriptional regulator LsrR (DeoR family)